MANRINLGSVKGDKGDTGSQGIQGETGANGITPTISNGNWWLGSTDTGVVAEGGLWYVGAGQPSIQGKNGDLYLDNTTADVYKKTSGVWEIVANIKGQKGDKGDTGSQGERGLDGNTTVYVSNEAQSRVDLDSITNAEIDAIFEGESV